MKNKTLYWIGAVVVLAIILLVAGKFTGGGTGPVDENAPPLVKGPANASVTLVEYGDFQCPACGAYYPLVEEVFKLYPTQLKFEFRNFPLKQIHPNALPAARAAMAANVQGKFWEMYDKLYQNQTEWSGAVDARSLFAKYAEDIGLDVTKFEGDYAGKVGDGKINADLAQGEKDGVPGTPTFLVNGTKLAANPKSTDEFKAVIDAAIKNAPPPSITSEPAYHAHFDFLLVSNGAVVDLNKPEYQESKTNPLDPKIHLHGGNGAIVHIHDKGATIGEWLTSVKKTPADWSVAKLYVNGVLYRGVVASPAFVPHDLDRVVLIEGNVTEAQIQKYLGQVTDQACIYSEKCPERGRPPTEECVGGLGTTCEEGTSH